MPFKYICKFNVKKIFMTEACGEQLPQCEIGFYFMNLFSEKVIITLFKVLILFFYKTD